MTAIQQCQIQQQEKLVMVDEIQATEESDKSTKEIEQ